MDRAAHRGIAHAVSVSASSPYEAAAFAIAEPA